MRQEAESEGAGCRSLYPHQFIPKEGAVFLKVENSFDGRVVRKPQNEYQGTMDFKVKGRVFILSVMMKNEKEED